jgi:peptide-methionine (R)-S-oxide reductase
MHEDAKEAEMGRRQILMGGLGVIGLGAMARFLGGASTTGAANAAAFEVVKTEEEWRRALTPAQFNVLREHGTERAGSSPLNDEHRHGTFSCAGCDLPVYSSDTKFDSGTGWPSFWAPIKGAVETSEDRGFLTVRTEVHCRRCGGHLGHVFDDGPAPTRLRYCMNGAAMKFTPA